jgi:hypothetical protein
MTERVVDGLLDHLVAPVVEHGDWEDVLRRAGVATEPAAPISRPGANRSARRRRALALALLLVGAGIGLLATPAFGLRERVLALLGRTDVRFESRQTAPSVVRYRFADLGLGAPPGMAPNAIASQTRRVGTLLVNGTQRTLWVAPTRRGGFCYEIEQAYGGCQRVGGERLPPVSLTYSAGVDRQGVSEVLHVGGTVLSDRVARITVEFGDGATRDVPFLFVSEPIAAGFFSLDIPTERRRQERGPRAVVARDARGTVVWREDQIHYRRGIDRAPRRTPRTVVRRKLPARLGLPPSPPLRRGTGNGVRVVAGTNGVVLFDARDVDVDAATRRLLGTSVSYGCFRLVRRDDVLLARGYSIAARFSRRAAARFFGLGALDACEIQGSYGHRWPDRNRSHSAVEVPFTARARAYFPDRAAARKLALFVRARRVQQIRRRAGESLAAGLRHEFGTRIVRVAAGATPPAGRIGYRPTARGGVFMSTSETGRRFQVVVADGRIVRENVKPLAFVF